MFSLENDLKTVALHSLEKLVEVTHAEMFGGSTSSLDYKS